MTFFRVGPAGIPGSIKTDMNNVLNKKFGTTGQDYPPTDWPADVNLLGELEVKTASGAIASFTDGADDVPLASASFGIVPAGGGGTPSDPVAITGYSGMTITHIGKNIFNYEDVSPLNANVTITRSDGDYTVQNNNSYAVSAFYSVVFRLKPATYSLSLGEGISVPIRIYKNGSWFNNGINAGSTSCTFTVTEEDNYDFSCNVPANSSLTIKKCQFEVGATATTYEAYTAPETISDTFGRTVYGGTRALDGTLTDEYKHYNLSALTWSGGILGGVAWCWYVDLSADGLKLPTNSAIFEGLCDRYAPIRFNGVSGTSDTIALRSNGVLYINNGSDTIEPDGEVIIKYDTPNTYALDPIAMSSYLGDNNIYCDTGDTSVDYRSSGTVTTITPTLITKSITDNGTYNAADDNADGYSQVNVNVSGGGSFTPTFTETLIADNTAHASSFTLSDSYSNYDLVKIVWYESASSSGYVVTTPDILDEIFTTAGKLCINKLNTNLYVCYSKAGLTWTQTNQRTIFVHEVFGITLTNCTMTATDIYKRGGMSVNAVTITSLTSLKDYDLFALSSQHNSDGTETMPCSWFIPYPDPDPLETAFGNPQPCVLEEYNQNNESFYMSEYEMTAAKYFMVQGLVFTPTV